MTAVDEICIVELGMDEMDRWDRRSGLVPPGLMRSRYLTIMIYASP